MYTVNSTAAYTEPALWTKNGGTWTLNDYKFAYGNKMSDADGNPFSIPSTGMVGSASNPSPSPSYDTTNSAAPPVAAMAVRSSAKMAGDAMIAYPYYGGYYNYQPAPVV